MKSARRPCEEEIESNAKTQKSDERNEHSLFCQTLTQVVSAGPD